MKSGLLPSLGLGLLLLGGCASTGTTSRAHRLDATEFRDRGVSPSAMVRLTAQGTDVGFADIATGGAFRPFSGRSHNPVIHVRLLLHNGDAAALQVPRDELFLTVDGKSVVTPLAVYFEAKDRTTPVVVAAGETGILDVVFPLPDEVDPDSLLEFDVRWGVDLAGGQLRRATTFWQEPGKNGTRLAGDFRPASSGTQNLPPQ